MVGMAGGPDAQPPHHDTAAAGFSLYWRNEDNMRSNRQAPLVIPILIIIVGVGWLLTAQGFGPGINWVWTLGLAAIGILTFLLSGFDKVSVVVGPFFLVSSLLSVLRQTGGLDLS